MPHNAEKDATPTWAGLFGAAPGIDLTGDSRYIVGYFCHKGGGHFEMYDDPDAEMACGSSLVPIYLDAEDAAWYRKHDLLPPGRWENETPPTADRGASGEGCRCVEPAAIGSEPCDRCGRHVFPPARWDEEADAMFINKAREAIRDTTEDR